MLLEGNLNVDDRSITSCSFKQHLESLQAMHEPNTNCAVLNSNLNFEQILLVYLLYELFSWTYLEPNLGISLLLRGQRINEHHVGYRARTSSLQMRCSYQLSQRGSKLYWFYLGVDVKKNPSSQGKL